jgi:hypothetical protein
MTKKETPKDVVEPTLPSLEELMNASNLNEAQQEFKKVLEHYKIKNPKKFEVKREAYIKKMIALGN